MTYKEVYLITRLEFALEYFTKKTLLDKEAYTPTSVQEIFLDFFIEENVIQTKPPLWTLSVSHVLKTLKEILTTWQRIFVIYVKELRF